MCNVQCAMCNVQCAIKVHCSLLIAHCSLLIVIFFNPKLFIMSRQPLTNMQDLLEYELRDLYSAEEQLLKVLPDMSNAAKHAELKDTFDLHLKETREQKYRLQEIAETLDVDLRGGTCQAMKGLIQESQQVIGMKGDDDTKDAALIAAAQRIEHYEIAGYGSAYRFAQQLQHLSVANHLKQTLEEEKEADSRLSHLALEKINEEAS